MKKAFYYHFWKKDTVENIINLLEEPIKKSGTNLSNFTKAEINTITRSSNS